MGMGTVGLLGSHLLLVVIAMLVFFGASAAEAEERAYTVLSTRRVGDADNQQAITLGESGRVSTVIGHLLTSYHGDLAVMRGSTLLGVVSRRERSRAIMVICP